MKEHKKDRWKNAHSHTVLGNFKLTSNSIATQNRRCKRLRGNIYRVFVATLTQLDKQLMCAAPWLVGQTSEKV